ncbi:hypothetical protein ABIC24_003877 [Methylobacterium radiotolerans]
MASAAEQLAANLNFGAIAKADELKKRIWFTLGALVVFRLGTYIPIPGIDPEQFARNFQQQAGGVLGLFNMFSGGAVERMAIFALNIMPYISASIIVQLLTSVIPSLEALKKEGESGRKVINQYTRYLTVVLALVQSWGIAIGLQGSSAAIDPGPFFLASTVITLTGGTLFLMWLGEQITSRGIGNGSSLIIFAGIVAHLPVAIAGALELGRTGALSPAIILGVGVAAVALVYFIVFMERAQRPAAYQLPEAPGRQPHVRGPDLVPAAQAQHLGRDPADLRLVAAAAAGHRRELLGQRWRHRLARHGHRLSRPRHAAVHGALRGADHLLHVLLHGGGVQSAGDGRQPEEAWRLHPGYPPG